MDVHSNAIDELCSKLDKVLKGMSLDMADIKRAEEEGKDLNLELAKQEYQKSTPIRTNQDSYTYMIWLVNKLEKRKHPVFDKLSDLRFERLRRIRLLEASPATLVQLGSKLQQELQCLEALEARGEEVPETFYSLGKKLEKINGDIRTVTKDFEACFQRIATSADPTQVPQVIQPRDEIEAIRATPREIPMEAGQSSRGSLGQYLIALAAEQRLLYTENFLRQSVTVRTPGSSSIDLLLWRKGGSSSHAN